MRIYKSDGSFIDNHEDDEFGWFFGDITIDESIENYAQRNRELFSLAVLRKTTKHDFNFDCSVDVHDANNEIDSDVIICEPNIKIQAVKSFVDPILLSNASEDQLESSITCDNIENSGPSNIDIANLIDPCSAESKLLLSVIHNAKYRNLVKDVINLGDLRANKKIKNLVTRRRSRDLERDVRQEVRYYHKIKEESMLSLMMELILSDMRCDVSDIADRHESSDLGNSINSEEDSDGGMSEDASNLPNNLKTESCWSNTGVSEAIDHSLGRISDETYDIHLEIVQLRKHFQEDQLRLNRLICETQTLERSLRETKYLDDLLHLLNGELDHVKIDNSPFRIFLAKGNDQTEANLII